MQTILIPRETKIEIITYMVDKYGKDRPYFGKDGNVSKTTKVLTVLVPIVCKDDTCTEVELYPDGHLEIMGWDGTEGLGDDADTFTDKEISKLFHAMM